MSITVATNYPNDTAGIRIYETVDQGQMWINVGEIARAGVNLRIFKRNIERTYYVYYVPLQMENFL
ncbi:MAG: hypothetical protein ACPLN0_03225 [Candidatus Hydrothermia bacterium]